MERNETDCVSRCDVIHSGIFLFSFIIEIRNIHELRQHIPLFFNQRTVYFPKNVIIYIYIDFYSILLQVTAVCFRHNQVRALERVKEERLLLTKSVYKVIVNFMIITAKTK